MQAKVKTRETSRLEKAVAMLMDDTLKLVGELGGGRKSEWLGNVLRLGLRGVAGCGV